MTKGCAIARDLMPLTLDGAASEDSGAFVKEHIASCEPCKGYYEGLTAALAPDAAADGAEKTKLKKAARALRGRRRMRILRNIIIGIFIGALLTGGGYLAWKNLTQIYHVTVYTGEYGVFLSQLSDGRVSVSVDFRGSSVNMASWLEERQEDGKTILYVYVKRPYVKRYLETPMHNYSPCILTEKDMEGIDEIRQGTKDESLIVWKKGEDIPKASDEMEKYFTLLGQRDALTEQVFSEAPPRAVTRENEIITVRLGGELEDARNAVPEWQ